MDHIADGHGAAVPFHGLHHQVAAIGHVDRPAHEVIDPEVDTHLPSKGGRAGPPFGQQRRGTVGSYAGRDAVLAFAAEHGLTDNSTTETHATETHATETSTTETH